jgi:hypothetical protein
MQREERLGERQDLHTTYQDRGGGGNRVKTTAKKRWTSSNILTICLVDFLKTSTGASQMELAYRVRLVQCVHSASQVPKFVKNIQLQTLNFFKYIAE